MKLSMRVVFMWWFAGAICFAQAVPEDRGKFRDPGRDSDTSHPPAETGAIREKLRRELVSVLDYGAKCDGVTDDSDAINNALSTANRTPGTRVIENHGATGGTIRMPPGSCGVLKTIVLPRGVNLVGASVSGSAIVALSGFTPNSPVIRIGDATGGTPLSYSSVRDLWVDCAGAPGCTAIFSSKMQENSYIENVLIAGYSVAGIDLESYAVQNTYIRNVTSYTRADATDAVCIKLDHATSRMMIENVTCNANPSQKHGAGIELINSEAAINNVHCEYYDICVDVGAGSMAEIHNIKGHPTVGMNVRVAGNASGAIVENSSADSRKVNVCDQLRGGTASCGGGSSALAVNDPALNFYATGFNRNGNILTSSGATQNLINSLRANALTLGSSTNAPPCASLADQGRIWINTAANPARFEVCLGDRGAFQWQYTTMNPGP